MSRLFGVTTDYLLKDELEESQPAECDAAPVLRRVTMAQASDYLALRRAAAPKMALATMLCVFSPIALIGLGGLSELSVSAVRITEDAAGGIGLCVLIVLVAMAVALFISCGNKAKEYEFLEKEPFETEYGVTGMVKERQKAFKPAYDRMNLIGTMLCILSVLPLFAAAFSGRDFLAVMAVCVLLALVGIGTYFFVYGGTVNGAMEKLLEEGDYTRDEKSRKNITGPVSVIYWLVVTAIFVLYTFGPNGNGQPRYSWIIWAVAGVLYGAVMAVIRLIKQRNK